ncbi:hypothetical protein ACEWY4_008703 [Coilia grayii]|uniref:Ig-like domain-containing protein n=1 Tax=Coilia grayii TaxID=363190 RepID=A0ABD1KBL3_9TELE
MKPSLSLETGAEVTWGQSVQMSCSISTQHLGGTFTLQLLSGSFRDTKRVSGGSATFTIPQVAFMHEGAYYCQYQTPVSGRDFTSSQSNTVKFSVTVCLVQPNISVRAPDGGLFWGPQGPKVTRGHSLSILCSTEAQYQGGSFHLLFDGSNTTRTQSALNHSASFYIPELDHSHQGNYSCVYEVTVSSRTFSSNQTEPLTLIVKASLAPIWTYGVRLFLIFLIVVSFILVKKYLNDKHTSQRSDGAHLELQKPSLSLETGAEVTWGQSVQMSCSISTRHLGGTFTLQQLSGPFRDTKTVSGGSATFTIPQVDFIHEGAYYCQYQTQVSGRGFTSSRSNIAKFSVTVSLVQPNISVRAPDGGLFWGPQGPEVTRGHSLSILCCTEAQYQGGSFHLLFDGSNTTRTQSALNHSASFYIPELDHSHQGNYSCVYEVTVSSRTFSSTQTEPLTLIVKGTLETSIFTSTKEVAVELMKPSLSLETGAEVTWGQSVKMSCSISTQHLGGTFTLQQLSGSFRDTKRVSGGSATFTIPQVDFIHEGVYYCQYQTRVSGRDFTSSQSNTVRFSVTGETMKYNHI